MANDSNVDELLAAQTALAETVREYITQLTYQLRTEKIQANRDEINHQIAQMVPIYISLTGRNIAILAARTKDDVANIMAVSKDVQQFIYGIKRIEGMLSVATSIVKFVVVCMADTKNPVAIYKAGQNVYDAINAIIELETPKGNSAAINLKKLKAIMVSSLVGGKATAVKKVPVAKVAGAAVKKKPAIAGAKKNK